MNARYAMLEWGETLIGQIIMTEPIGGYPGGPAKVIGLNPDPVAPEVVIQVFNPAYGEIGIFDNEQIGLIGVPT